MRKPHVAISVLVVDDDRDARAMYRMYLMHVGCKVRTARDGHAAITKANAWAPDVIVMDLAMPRLDGWTASRWLKSSPATAHIPIIALSAALAAREHAREAGCDGFLAKPCQPDLLWWEIRALLHPEA
ncbi:MAG: Signal transduction response regulator [Acidobacteria bacterium]|nr:Signal transduction response regulator [Acidobacteriota bacterium]